MYYFLEKIYPQIKKKIPEIRLNIIGGNATAKLKRFASKDSSLNIFGFVGDVLPHLQKASAFIVPILSGSGTRLKILEAMAAGKAIVSTGVGCEGIEGVNGEHYLIADDPAAFSDSVYRVLRDRNLQEDLGHKARKLVKKKYDWDIICGKLNSLYSDLKRRG
jgi:glycosyltransferase involved in cell wall biosynthesis